MNIKQENDKGKIMNALRIARITNKLIIELCCKYANIVKSFKMTEREWEKYSELHPNAKKENHQIIPSFNRNNSSQFCWPYNNYLDDFLKDIQKLSIDEAIKKICDSEVGGIVLDKSNFAGIQMAHDICNNLEKEIENFNFDSGDHNELVALLNEEKAMRDYINQYNESIENFFMDAFAILFEKLGANGKVQPDINREMKKDKED